MSIFSTVARRVGTGTLGVAAAGAGLAAAGVTLASLAGGGIGSDPFSGTVTAFPDDLDTIDHWISFQAVQTNGVASGFINSMLDGLSIGSNYNVPGGSVYLPMPANLSTDYNPTYTSANLDMVAGSALKPFDRQLYGNEDIPGAAAAGAALAGTVGAGLAGAAGRAAGVSLSGSGIDAALKVFGGIAQNPHKIVLFTGVDFREHTFSWKLSPKNRKESDSIRGIIDFFKYYSHPEYVAGGLFFKYPEYFNINFHHPEYLFTLRPSVCKDIRVNYHSQGYPAYIRDADGGGYPAPAEVELSLTFQETEVITKNSLNPPIAVRSEPRRRNSPGATESIGPTPQSENGPTFTPGA